MSSENKPTQCDKCGADSQSIEFKQMMTFEYWYCHACGEEVNGEEEYTGYAEYTMEFDGKPINPSNGSTINYKPQYPNVQKPSVLADQIDFFQFIRWTANQYNLRILSEVADGPSSTNSNTEFYFELRGPNIPAAFDTEFEKNLKNLLHPVLTYHNLLINRAPLRYNSEYAMHISFKVPIQSSPSLNTNYGNQSTHKSSCKTLTPTEREITDFSRKFLASKTLILRYTDIDTSDPQKWSVFCSSDIAAQPQSIDADKIAKEYEGDLQHKLPAGVSVDNISGEFDFVNTIPSHPNSPDKLVIKYDLRFIQGVNYSQKTNPTVKMSDDVGIRPLVEIRSESIEPIEQSVLDKFIQEFYKSIGEE